jgi:hypothetical protein
MLFLENGKADVPARGKVNRNADLLVRPPNSMAGQEVRVSLKTTIQSDLSSCMDSLLSTLCILYPPLH